MRRRHRQRKALGLSALLVVALVSWFDLAIADARATQPKLSVTCDAAKSAPGGATATCDVRAAGYAEFTEVKAKIKGRSEDIASKFTSWKSREAGSATSYLIQVLPNSRRRTLAEMADAVVALADQRKAKRRFSVYSFGNELTLLSDSGASKEEFARQIVAVKPAAGSVELYKAALRAIEALAKEAGGRKALVIIGDGKSDDMGYTHDQVVKAARDAGISIHALGYYDDKDDRPNFQTLSRLADDTGGFAAEVKSPGSNHSSEVITGRFVDEVLENGGSVDLTLKEPKGPAAIVFTAYLADGTTVTQETTITVPEGQIQPAVPTPSPAFDSEPPPNTESVFQRVFDWLEGNTLAFMGLGAVLGLGLVALARSKLGANRSGEAGEAAGGVGGAAQGTEPATIYGWLEALEGTRERYPLTTTNVRVGRHRDNDICLPFDSISRRHAVVHYNPETRRFVITDLGGGNGVVVNKTKHENYELSDGDVVELGDVKLKFRTQS